MINVQTQKTSTTIWRKKEKKIMKLKTTQNKNTQKCKCRSKSQRKPSVVTGHCCFLKTSLPFCYIRDQCKYSVRLKQVSEEK